MAKTAAARKAEGRKAASAKKRTRIDKLKTAKPAVQGRRREGRVRKEFWLPSTKLEDARRVLGTTTDVDTVEAALDLVVFRDEVRRGVQGLGGLGLSRID
ncbi:MAG: hypothetical protein ABI637_06330 [Gemmatimonadota bacterium]